MPCILAKRESSNSGYHGACGKFLGGGFNAFKSIEAAYEGDKPICAACRKKLNLEPKIISIRITNSFFNSSDKLFTLKFNKKESIELELNFDLINGFTLIDDSLLTDDEKKYTVSQLRVKSINYAQREIKNIEINNEQFLLIDKLIKQAKDESEKEQLNELKKSLLLFKLKELPYIHN
jgi:hypothetical protein